MLSWVLALRNTPNVAACEEQKRSFIFNARTCHRSVDKKGLVYTPAYGTELAHPFSADAWQGFHTSLGPKSPTLEVANVGC